MFFALSKIFWFVVQPSGLILIALVLGLVLVARGRMRWGRRLLIFGVAVYAVAGLSPLGHWLTAPLEDRFPRPARSDLAAVGAIIVLGGVADERVGLSRQAHALIESGERLTEAAWLANQFPAVPVVFSGGSGRLLPGDQGEAAAAVAILRDLGVGEGRIHFEDRSRNTYENALETKLLLAERGVSGPLILITSAFHMPRAMGCFRAAGLDVMAWPVDYRTAADGDPWRLFSQPAEGLRRVDQMVREWIGLFAYWATGRTAEVLPAP